MLMYADTDAIQAMTYLIGALTLLVYAIRGGGRKK